MKVGTTLARPGELHHVAELMESDRARVFPTGGAGPSVRLTPVMSQFLAEEGSVTVIYSDPLHMEARDRPYVVVTLTYEMLRDLLDLATLPATA